MAVTATKVNYGPVVAWVSVGLVLLGMLTAGVASVQRNTTAIVGLTKSLESMAPALQMISDIDKRVSVNERGVAHNDREIDALKAKVNQ